MRISDWSSDVCSSDLWPSTPRSSATPSPGRRLIHVDDVVSLAPGVADARADLFSGLPQRVIADVRIPLSRPKLRVAKKLADQVEGEPLPCACRGEGVAQIVRPRGVPVGVRRQLRTLPKDRKSTRLNSSH